MYNQSVFTDDRDIFLSLLMCPGGPMDKTMDSGSVNAGSIPARDAILSNISSHMDAGVLLYKAECPSP